MDSFQTPLSRYPRSKEAQHIMKLSSRLVSTLICTLTTFAGLISSAHAENFTLSGGVSLNTNNSFATVDGSPRLSLWAQNNNDNDQIFDRITGNKGGTLLKNRTTGTCINAHYTYNYGKVNVWNCDANDIEQNFDILDFGNSVTVLRRTGTNFCINSPQHYNAGQVFMWDCNGNDPDQRFVRSNTAISANPPGTTPLPTTQQVVTNADPLNEVWIVARKRSDYSRL
jgi:Ricin-type beta-trefoil lectin domain